MHSKCCLRISCGSCCCYCCSCCPSGHPSARRWGPCGALCTGSAQQSGAVSEGPAGVVGSADGSRPKPQLARLDPSPILRLIMLRVKKPSVEAKVYGQGNWDLGRGRDLAHIPQRGWQNCNKNPGLLTPWVWASCYHSALPFLHIYIKVVFAELPSHLTSPLIDLLTRGHYSLGYSSLHKSLDHSFFLKIQTQSNSWDLC